MQGHFSLHHAEYIFVQILQVTFLVQKLPLQWKSFSLWSSKSEMFVFYIVIPVRMFFPLILLNFFIYLLLHTPTSCVSFTIPGNAFRLVANSVLYMSMRTLKVMANGD